MDRRAALSTDEVAAIQKNIFAGLYNDWEIERLFETILIQRTVLRALLNLHHVDPLRLISNPDPIRTATLAEYKRTLAMEDGQQ